MRKAYIESTRKGVFGTTSVRVKPITKKEDVEVPGPAHYQIKEKPFQNRYQNMTSQFSSVTSRLKDPPTVVKVRMWHRQIVNKYIFATDPHLNTRIQILSCRVICVDPDIFPGGVLGLVFLVILLCEFKKFEFFRGRGLGGGVQTQIEA